MLKRNFYHIQFHEIIILKCSLFHTEIMFISLVNRITHLSCCSLVLLPSYAALVINTGKQILLPPWLYHRHGPLIENNNNNKKDGTFKDRLILELFIYDVRAVLAITSYTWYYFYLVGNPTWQYHYLKFLQCGCTMLKITKFL